MTVMSFKFSNGQELVAEARENTTILGGSVASYNLKKPLVIQIQRDMQGNVGLAFVPWLLSHPDILSIDIPVSAFIAVFSPALEVEKQYLAQTSGIDLSTSI